MTTKLGNIKILIVEDDALVATDIATTLEKYGYSILGPYDSGEKVLKSISKLQPDFVLMDIHLKGPMDGIETAEMIQKLWSVPIVFLTGLHDEATLQRAKLSNVFGYLIKPYNEAELHSTIQMTLHHFQKEVATHKSPDAMAEFLNSELNNISSANDIVTFLTTLPVFQNIPMANLEMLAQGCAIREIEAGQFIMVEGQKPTGTFITLSGRISITKTAESGKELIVALLAPGDLFGLFYGIPSFAGSTSAKTQIDSRIIWIAMLEWTKFSTSNPLIYHNISHALAERLNAAHSLASSLAHAPAEGRIIHTLLALLPEFGHLGSPSIHDSGRIFITRKELSELTGTTPETAIRVTKSLERDSLLDLSHPGVIKIPSVKKLKHLVQA